MKRMIVICCILLATASVASASGVNLGWGTAGAITTPAPTTDTGYTTLNCSLASPTPMSVCGVAIELLVEFDGPVPDWWVMGCRGSWSSWLHPVWAPVWRPDPAAGNNVISTAALGSISDHAVTVTYLWASLFPVSLAGGVDYYMGSLNILNMATSKCGGSGVPARITFTHAELASCDGSSSLVITPGPQGTVLWAADTGTPTRATTWGKLKSFYRD
jgi:hypothetical protein